MCYDVKTGIIPYQLETTGTSQRFGIINLWDIRSLQKD